MTNAYQVQKGLSNDARCKCYLANEKDIIHLLWNHHLAYLTWDNWSPASVEVVSFIFQLELGLALI